MAIPETQLETWSHQGSVIQSASTYGTIKAALEDSTAKYASRKPKVFLQGSYCNDTNIYAESDVDIVILYETAWFSDLSDIPPEQQAAYNSSYSDGTYPYRDFKKEVEVQLESAFPNAVRPDVKAIKIAAEGSRRSADVIVAFRYRRYFRFNSRFDERFASGISLWTSGGVLIANYPEQHAANCTAKHQATGNRFKPLVRVFKNMRGKLEQDGVIQAGVAPSYFIEGLLYNVPPEKFAGSYQKAARSILEWLYVTTDQSNFECANGQYYLLRDNTPVCWPIANGNKFITACVELWDGWA